MFNLKLKEALYKGEVELQEIIDYQKKQLGTTKMDNIINKTAILTK